MNKKVILKITAVLLLLNLAACVKDKNFDRPANACANKMVANSSYTQLKELYKGETIQIREDLIIEGYVVSSDEAGNFFNVLHIQDSPSNPTEGFQIEIEMRDSHLFYPTGTKVMIKLKGLYFGQSKNVYKIGSVFTSFGNKSVGRLPASVIDKHLYISCEEQLVLKPALMTLENINEGHTNTLVQFAEMEFLESDLSKSYAVAQEETERTLINCDDSELVLRTSGYSDFQSDSLPVGKGSITGILLREGEDYFLTIRRTEDIDFAAERCADLVVEFSSPNIFISELADPNNNLDARFIELYHSGNETLSLNGWSLRRYTNANSEVSSSIDLSELSVAPHSTIVIAANAAVFESTYGIAPDLEAGGNSAANSNGDDNIQLVDPFGAVIDVFGIVGEDGSGTNHEFEDGRALRKATISQGYPLYIFSEWEVYNDSGDAGTIKEPQNAPEDFTPGSHI